MKKFTLYLGLNDKETKQQEFKTEEAIYIVGVILIDDFGLSGATIQTGYGIYKHDDGFVTKETTIIITLLDISDNTVNEIIDRLKSVFNQECILKEVSLVDFSFM